MRTFMLAVTLLGITVLAAGSVQADTLASLQAGGDRLVATQNTDGAWGWPVTGASAPNTIGPIGMGLAKAYAATGDADHLAALVNLRTYFLAKTNNFSPSDGYLAVQLDGVLGGTTCRDHVMTNYYDKLAAGTYNRNGAGTLYNTADYVASIRAARSGDYANMGAWDIAMGLYGAAKIGADTTAWLSGTQTKVNELDDNNYYAQLGLAASILGLTAAGQTSFDPTSGSFAAAGNVRDLADKLTTYQISGGGITWYKDYMTAGSETTQETAYSILALAELDRAGYATQIAGAADWLMSAQMVNGGWGGYIGDTENNAITGEAMWGIGVAPEPATMALLALGGALALVRRVRGRKA